MDEKQQLPKDKVLIIEDEEALAASLVTELSSKFFIFEAARGDKGLETALETKPDLILLDILLPKMSGEELLTKLRQDPWGKKVKVIVITNLEDPMVADRLRALGISDYLVKSSTSLKDLASIIFKVLHPDRPLYFNLAKDTPENLQ